MQGQKLSTALWACCAPALALLAPGIAALLTHQVVLFASLAPTAVTMIQQPGQPAARTYNALVGHAAGLTSAFVFVALLHLSTAPSVFEVRAVSSARVAAAVLAIALATLLELLLRAQHPPAASTTLLAALGSFHPTGHDVALVTSGVVLVTAASALLRVALQALMRSRR